MRRNPWWLFAFLAVFITLIWFSSGRFIGTGEEGLSLYRPQTTYRLYSSPWYDTGVGMAIPVYLPRLAFIGLSALFSLILPSWLIQALWFTLLIFTGMWGSWLLFRWLKWPAVAAFFGALFYFFNLFGQSQVWNRFLYAGMFAWSYLPLFLYLLGSVLSGRSRWNYVGLIFSLTLFANAFGHPAYILVFAFSGLIIVITSWFHNKNKIWLRLALATAVMLLSQLWWIWPNLTLGSSSFSVISSWQDNFSSLQGVSQYFPPSQLLLLRQSYLFGPASPWSQFYSLPGITLISLLVVLTAFAGLISARFRSGFWPLFIFGLISWFVIKGTSPPAGFFIYYHAFRLFPFLAALRNPYEKFGIVWLLTFSAFWGYGCYRLVILSKFTRLLLVIITFITLGILVKPLWLGTVYQPSVRLQVPPVYSHFNRQLTISNSQRHRLLVLPLLDGDGVKLSWGYNGIEPSDFLFDSPVISRWIRNDSADNYYKLLTSSLAGNSDLAPLLNAGDIGYILYRGDLISASSSSITHDNYQRLVTSWGQPIASESGFTLYQALATPSAFSVTPNTAVGFSHSQLSSTHWRLQVRASAPFDLTFSRGYDPRWQLIMPSGQVLKPASSSCFTLQWTRLPAGIYSLEIRYKIWPWQ